MRSPSCLASRLSLPACSAGEAWLGTSFCPPSPSLFEIFSLNLSLQALANTESRVIRGCQWEEKSEQETLATCTPTKRTPRQYLVASAAAPLYPSSICYHTLRNAMIAYHSSVTIMLEYPILIYRSAIMRAAQEKQACATKLMLSILGSS